MIMLTLFQNFFSPPRDLILVVAAIWLGSWLAEKRAERFGLGLNDLNNIIYYPLLGFILGGRVLYVLENLPAFTSDLRSLVSLNISLFDTLGGLVTALLVAFIYGKQREVPFWHALDALTPLFASIFIGLSLANLASGSAFGMETDLPWAVTLWGATRHPSQVYAFFASLLTLLFLWFYKMPLKPGTFFLSFSAITSGWLLFLEAFRGDSVLVLGGFRLAQIASWFVLVAALVLLDRKYLE